MSTSYLPLQDIVDVTVQVSPQTAGPPSFNQGLIIGPSGVIPTSGANSRIRKYSTLAGMLSDGFIVSDPEYIAAQIYFSQSPAPQFIWIGAQDPSGINALNIHSGNAGTGYAVGDTFTITQGGASGGIGQVTAETAGVPTAISLVAAGHGYTVASALATVATKGVGTGLEIDITVVLEPAILAAQACRLASSYWYGFMVTDAVDADHLALAAWVQTATPNAYYFGGTADANVLNNVTNNIAAQMQTLSYKRVMLMYSTTQSSVYPNNIYIAAAVLGEAMGLTTGLAGSYSTMKFKSLVGIAPEPLTQSQVTTIEGLNCNLYLNYANTFSFLEQGIEPGGSYWFQTVNLDMLVANIQINLTDILVASPAVPQTDPGENLLMNAVNSAADTSVQIGYLAGGTWEGVTILGLTAGTVLPKGYLTQAQSYAVQTPANRAARQAMPIYLCIIESGAVHFITVAVTVQQ